jgi:hypothetical protein
MAECRPARAGAAHGCSPDAIAKEDPVLNHSLARRANNRA